MKLKLILALLLSCCSFSLYAQEAELEDGKVYIDGKAVLKYEKINVLEFSFYTADDEEILNFRSYDNGTPSYHNDDYFILNFLTAKTKVESTSFVHIISGMGMNGKKNMQKMIGWLLKEKVLDAKGNLNLQKLETFYDKYNENITARTIR